MDHPLVRSLRARVFAEPALLGPLLGAADPAEALAAIAGTSEAWSRLLAELTAAAEVLPEWRLVEAPPPGWLPVAFMLDGEAPWIEWLPIDLAKCDNPFYQHATDAARAAPAGKLLRCATPIAALAALADAPTPTALVFHVSRCGSTLVGRMLDALDDTVVVSEPGPLDIAIRMWRLGAIPPAWLRGMAAALVRTADGPVQHRVIKLDAWHTLALPSLANLFPEARKLFLFRDGVEVLVSQRRAPGSHAVRGEIPLAVYGLDGEPPSEEDAFAPWVIGAIMRAGLAGASRADMLLCDYAELPDAVLGRIAPHFGIPAPERDARERLRSAAQTYSKDARRAHLPDTEAKQRAADDRLRALVGRYGIDTVYDKLKRARENSTVGRARTAAATAPRVRVSVSYAPGAPH